MKTTSERMIVKNKDVTRILFCIHKRAKSAGEISRSLNIPLKQTYNLLGMLKKNSLVTVDSQLMSPNGRIKRFFKAEIAETYIDLNETGNRVRLESLFNTVKSR